MSSNFKAFLERLRVGRLPLYGSLRWDGENGEVITAINFELDHKESAETVCRRAYEYFAQLTPEEQRVLDIDVTTRQGKPVRATLKPLVSGVITTGRLRQLEDVLARK